MRTVTEVGPRLGIAPTCAALGVPRASYYRRRQPQGAPASRLRSFRSLSPDEQYRPTFPTRFGSIQDARAHCHVFFPWAALPMLVVFSWLRQPSFYAHLQQGGVELIPRA